MEIMITKKTKYNNHGHFKPFLQMIFFKAEHIAERHECMMHPVEVKSFLIKQAEMA